MSVPTAENVSVHALRSLLRLVSDLKDLPDGSVEQRRLALSRLSLLLGANVALWIEIPHIEGGVPVLDCPIDMGWGTTSERAVFRHYLSHQRELIDPACMRVAEALSAGRSTVLRSDVIGDREWYGSEHVQDIRRAARVDSFMLAFRLRPGGRISTISLHRPWNDLPFTPTDRAILDAFRRESPWLDSEPATPLHDVALSPRLTAVLRALLRGLSEKEVASELDLSPHTTHDYVKSLYRRLGVRSRAELLARSLGPAPGGARPCGEASRAGCDKI